MSEVAVNKVAEGKLHQPLGDGEFLEVIPLVDIYENPEEFVVVADLPGVNADDLSVQLHAQRLQLAGRQQAAKGQRYKLFQRTFQVPKSVDPAEVSAELSAGVLRLRLRKAAHSRPREIPIQAS